MQLNEERIEVLQKSLGIITKCTESWKEKGYEHQVITTENRIYLKIKIRNYVKPIGFFLFDSFEFYSVETGAIKIRDSASYVQVYKFLFNV